jgi:uncharacterized protein YfaS (alpha-2-macroglobulin family)
MFKALMNTILPLPPVTMHVTLDKGNYRQGEQILVSISTNYI